MGADAEPFRMERLGFELPEFLRISWVSDRARQVWEPRLQRIGECQQALEVLAVAEQVRPCCTVCVDPEALNAQSVLWREMGLIGLPFSTVRSGNGRPSPALQAAPREAFYHRVAIGRTADVSCFKAAYEAADHQEIGRLLGYPACCTAFLCDHPTLAGKDSTWLGVAGSEAMTGETRIAVLDPLPACNLPWRRLNIRSVAHLPCGFMCAPTQRLMDRIVTVGTESGYAQEMRWLSDVLSWPVEWSALHGIAEVKTPILKYCTNTEPTAGKYTVRLNGMRYPAEGARGARFSYGARDLRQ
jgi:hypothetical protein